MSAPNPRGPTRKCEVCGGPMHLGNTVYFVATDEVEDREYPSEAEAERRARYLKARGRSNARVLRVTRVLKCA